MATFGAHLCAVRICFSRLLREKQYSYPAQLSVKGVCQGGIVPIDPLLPPFGGAKGGPRRVGVLTKPCTRLRDADRRNEMITLIFAVNPSVSLAADSSPCTGEPLRRGEIWCEGGRGGWGFGAERRRWRMKRGGESVAVEKIEQTNRAKIFSGTARRAGLRPAER